jgi:hypothetical protein
MKTAQTVAQNATSPATPVAFASTHEENVVMDPAASLQDTPVRSSFSLEEILRTGITVRVDAPKKDIKDHAVDVGKGAIAVAGGIGVAAGLYALGNFVIGLFDSSETTDI